MRDLVALLRPMAAAEHGVAEAEHGVAEAEQEVVKAERFFGFHRHKPDRATTSNQDSERQPDG
jgi:hypothetical protein